MKTNTWNLDTAHSGINFSVSHMVFAKVRGRFGAWAGKVDLNLEDLTKSHVEVEIDASSIDTGVGDRDNHLRSPDFLEVEKFPTLRFVSTKVEKSNASNYRIHGSLTIRDVPREVVLETEYGGAGKDPWGNQRVAFTAKTSIERSDFGLKWNQVLEAGGVLVGEKINIEIEVQAVKAASSDVA